METPTAPVEESLEISLPGTDINLSAIPGDFLSAVLIVVLFASLVIVVYLFLRHNRHLVSELKEQRTVLEHVDKEINNHDGTEPYLRDMVKDIAKKVDELYKKDNSRKEKEG